MLKQTPKVRPGPEEPKARIQPKQMPIPEEPKARIQPKQMPSPEEPKKEEKKKEEKKKEAGPYKPNTWLNHGLSYTLSHCCCSVYSQ